MHVPSLILGYAHMQSLLSNTSDYLTNWMQAKTLAWPDRPDVNKIDTHHHFVPSFYSQGTWYSMAIQQADTNNCAAVASAGGDPSNWSTPKWSPLRSELLMD